jgi:hypothetical protein
MPTRLGKTYECDICKKYQYVNINEFRSIPSITGVGAYETILTGWYGWYANNRGQHVCKDCLNDRAATTSR